eukprot:3825179-Prymnesium_polylepis.3
MPSRSASSASSPRHTCTQCPLSGPVSLTSSSRLEASARHTAHTHQPRRARGVMAPLASIVYRGLVRCGRGSAWCRDCSVSCVSIACHAWSVAAII